MKKFLFLFFFLGAIQFTSYSQATFEVTTVNTTPEMDDAIDFALGIWGSRLKSNVPIKVHVIYASAVNLFLGVSISNARKNFPNAPQTDVWYPSSLANAIANEELNPGETDMEILIGQANWYFGVDGNPAGNQQDFVSVFLHEVCHSLGFVSLTKLDDAGLGTYGEVKPSDLGLSVSSFTFNDLEGLPGIFDTYLVDGFGKKLTDTANFTNNSLELGLQLRSNNLFFCGDSAVASTGGLNPRIYAGSNYQLGSSVSHVDEITYNNTVNSMMTPFSNAGTAEHEPGPIVTGVLYDIGWNQYQHPNVGIVEIPKEAIQLSVSPNPFNENAIWEFTLTQNSEVQLQVYNALGQEVFSSPRTDFSPGDHQIQWQADGFVPGLYHYQLLVGEGRTAASVLKW